MTTLELKVTFSEEDRALLTEIRDLCTEPRVPETEEAPAPKPKDFFQIVVSNGWSFNITKSSTIGKTLKITFETPVKTASYPIPLHEAKELHGFLGRWIEEMTPESRDPNPYAGKCKCSAAIDQLGENHARWCPLYTPF